MKFVFYYYYICKFYALIFRKNQNLTKFFIKWYFKNLALVKKHLMNFSIESFALNCLLINRKIKKMKKLKNVLKNKILDRIKVYQLMMIALIKSLKIYQINIKISNLNRNKIIINSLLNLIKKKKSFI
jgi:hypothetical protein